MFRVILSVGLLLHATGRPIADDLETLQTESSDEPSGVSLAVTESAQTARLKMLRREQHGPSPGPSPSPPPGGITCNANQVGYAVLSDSALAVIDMGPNTMSGKTEVRRLTSGSQYKDFKEDKPIETRMHLTASSNNNGDWTFLADGADNLVAVNSGMTASNKTEVHRLKFVESGPYQEFDVNVVTALPQKTSFAEWNFLLNSANDLVVIKKGPETPSSMTEVHVLAAAQSWQQFTLQAATGLHLTASTDNHGDWAFLLDGADNLVCIRRPTRTDMSIEVKRLTSGSNYQTFDLEDGGAELPHDSENPDVHWVFEIDPADDLLCIKEGPITEEGFTEIHKLSMASDYKTFTMTQTHSGAPCRQPHFIDSAGAR